MPYVVRALAHAYCAGSCDVYVQSTVKWRRSKRKSPRWTWILLSEGQTLPYYTKDTSRTKIRPSHVKIMVFDLGCRAFILKKKKMECRGCATICNKTT